MYIQDRDSVHALCDLKAIVISAIVSNFCSARSALLPFLLFCTTDSNISDFDHPLPLESRRDHLGWDSTCAHRDRTSTTRIVYTRVFARNTNRICYNIMGTTLIVGTHITKFVEPIHLSSSAYRVHGLDCIDLRALELFAPREVNVVRALQYM